MTNATYSSNSRRRRNALALPVLVLTVMNVVAAKASAQEAIGVPFIGSNHLSFSVTELSRDGIGTDRATVFGAQYGHRFGSAAAPVRTSVNLRIGARPFEGLDDGILDVGLTLAATREVRALGGLSVTSAAGVGAVAWGQSGSGDDVPDAGRIIVKVPVSAGVAYSLPVGGATIAPFAMVTGAYSTARNYVDSERVSNDNGWDVGHTAGVSLRFREAVLSVSGIHRERGLPNANRLAFSAGVSW